MSDSVWKSIHRPPDQIRTLLVFFWWVRIAFIPAALSIGVWFLKQLFDQVGAVASSASSAGGRVAYAAHVGGFIFGAATGRLFEGSKRADDQQENPNECH